MRMPQHHRTGGTTAMLHRHRKYNSSQQNCIYDQWHDWANINAVRLVDLVSGKWVRTNAPGKSDKNKSLSVKLDGDVIHIKDWTTDESTTLFSDQPKSRLETERLRRKRERQKRQAEAEKHQRQARAARKAQHLWSRGLTDGTHAYIEQKKLSGLHGARICPDTGVLLIPMWVSGVGLVNCQHISTNGDKWSVDGCRVKDAYSVIGSLDGVDCVLVAEGWATACTLYEETGLPVIVAFNAGNLKPVCVAIRQRFPRVQITVCADDDRHTHGNPGLTKANVAAAVVGGKVARPNLCTGCQCTDFNDQANCTSRQP